MVDGFASLNSSLVMRANMAELMFGFVNSLFHRIDLSFLLSSTLLPSLNGTVWSRIFILTCNNPQTVPFTFKLLSNSTRRSRSNYQSNTDNAQKEESTMKPHEIYHRLPCLVKAFFPPLGGTSREMLHLHATAASSSSIRSLSRSVPSDGLLPKVASSSSSRKACTAKIGWPRPSSIWLP